MHTNNSRGWVRLQSTAAWSIFLSRWKGLSFRCTLPGKGGLAVVTILRVQNTGGVWDAMCDRLGDNLTTQQSLCGDLYCNFCPSLIYLIRYLFHASSSRVPDRANGFQRRWDRAVNWSPHQFDEPDTDADEWDIQFYHSRSITPVPPWALLSWLPMFLYCLHFIFLLSSIWEPSQMGRIHDEEENTLDKNGSFCFTRDMVGDVSIRSVHPYSTKRVMVYSITLAPLSVPPSWLFLD